MIKENFLSSFLLLSESAIFDSEYWESIFFIRFLTIVYWVLLPLIMILLLGCETFFCKERIFLKQKFFSNLYKFNNLIHNGIFIFLGLLTWLNTCIIFYYIIDIFIAKNYVFYGKKWSFTQISDYHTAIHWQKGAAYFVSIVLTGYAVHVANFLFYIWYNKNKTDSFFAQKNWINQLPQIIAQLYVKHVYWEKPLGIHKRTMFNKLTTRFFR